MSSRRWTDRTSLADRGAVVTGAGAGIGLAIAAALVSAGARVMLADLDVAAADRAADALGPSAHAAACDVGDEVSVQQLRERVQDAVGEVDVLVNNAGVLSVAPVSELEWSEWQRVMTVNAGGTFLCSRAFADGMTARGAGAIVNVASISARRGDPTLAHYSASKAAIIAFTQALAQELGGDGVTVNAVCPGTVSTAMMKRLAAEWGESVEAVASRFQAAPSPQAPEEIAAAVVFLARSPTITGQALNVDGGSVFN